MSLTAKQRFVLLLKSIPSVTNVAGGRVFHAAPPGKPQQYPCLVYTQVSKLGLKDLLGSSGLTRYRFQVDCYSQDAADCDTLANDVSSLEGNTVAKPGNAIWTWQEEETDDYDPPVESEERGMRHTSVDLTVWM